MTPPLFLLDPLPDDDLFVLDGDEGRHAARVQRLGVGESLWVSDGRGAVLDCVVAEVLAAGLRLTVLGRRSEPDADPRLVVVQALPKGDRGELAVEMLTELGVDEVVPWAASRSIAQWRDARGAKALDKWRRTAREAAKQSRRVHVPVVAELATTAQVAERLGAATGLVLHEAAATSLAGAALPSAGEVVLVVGPEGGISDDELARFAAAGGQAVRLGEPVLRTSTAGVAALAALSVRLGRWQ
ncbi:MAG: rRNA (uracil1498-N3)-methyltransferase [Pseudonocardiales bacterium]|jgi:16S rRNA (uracil1498-N3)-methyltransferase|nr:rRNA (uracil1498-N3)-methyltransferase [Pseudonocardiales bacterium]